MTRSKTTVGLLVALVAAFTFGISGALVKPLLEAGWSPAAAVTVRALVGGIVLLPLALFVLRGKWIVMWHARWRILIMALIGVVGTQLVYFAAVQRIAVGTAILIEYMAPLLLVGFVWATSRKVPRAVVLIGSVVALTGLVLVVSPSGESAFDLLGLAFASMAAVGCAVYYIFAARPDDGVPPVALAASGLLIGGVVLAAAGFIGLVPFTATFSDIDLLGTPTAWWVPLLIIGVVATAISYATSITASEMLGSRLASFVGLLEVVAAALYAWILLGEGLTPLQIFGGVLILVGIGFVRSERVELVAAGLDEEPFPEIGRETGAIPVQVPESWVDESAELGDSASRSAVARTDTVSLSDAAGLAVPAPVLDSAQLVELRLLELELDQRAEFERLDGNIAQFDEDRTGPIAVQPA